MRGLLDIWRKHPGVSARLRPAIAIGLVLALLGGCALRSDTLQMQRDIAALQGQQEQILDQLAELEETRAKVNAIEHTLEALRLQTKNGTPPDTDEVLELLAAERHRTEQQLALVQEMIDAIEIRLADLGETAVPAHAVATAPKPQPEPDTAAKEPSRAAAVTSAPTPAPTPTATTHTVVPGETLGTIARDYLGDPAHWKSVWQANPQLTNPDHLEPGQVLTIPAAAPRLHMTAKAAPEPVATTTKPTPSETDGQTRHVVQPGETLGSIAADYLGNPRFWDVVWMANPDVTDPDTIEPGQTLVIPPSITVDESFDHAPPTAEPVTPKPVSEKPATAPAAEPGVVRHTVQPGDTLGSIAAAYLGDPDLWEWVWEANPHVNDPDRLEAGQVLLVPVMGVDEPARPAPAPKAPPVVAAPPAPATPPVPPTAAGPIRHEVRAGDTLGTIAGTYMGDPALWRLVWAANPWLSNPNALETGAVVMVPVISADTASYHTVSESETLGTIATLYFGDPAFWKVIWKANPQLTNPDRVTPGMVLVIPLVAAPGTNP